MTCRPTKTSESAGKFVSASGREASSTAPRGRDGKITSECSRCGGKRMNWSDSRCADVEECTCGAGRR
eukprot:scaffold22893_cov27-Tisochrysis_lutea.AAC.3